MGNEAWVSDTSGFRWVDQNSPNSGYITTDPTFTPSNTPAIPVELTVCQICGAEDVVVFCDDCKGVLQLARKKWAETVMEEIEDALS